MITRLIPRPLLSITLFILWVVLNNEVSIGTMMFGFLLALIMPLVVRPFWPDGPRLVRPGMALSFSLRVLTDIVVANWSVSRLVVGPIRNLSPAFVEVPLDVRDPFAATILASIVSLTPGTVSIDVDQNHWVLKIHALDVPDREALVRQIKWRYEKPIREILAC